MARANLAGGGQAGTTVRMALGWWFEALPPELAGELALVVSNPPYLADDIRPSSSPYGTGSPQERCSPAPTGSARCAR